MQADLFQREINKTHATPAMDVSTKRQAILLFSILNTLSPADRFRSGGRRKTATQIGIGSTGNFLCAPLLSYDSVFFT
jgi:hypothetical protein